MIDCSKTGNYLKEKYRMSNNCEDCTKCVLMTEQKVTNMCGKYERLFPNLAIELVQKWSDEHPVKTLSDDFFEKFPNALKEPSGIPKACMRNIYGGKDCCDGTSCADCWNRPYTQEITHKR